MGSTSGLGYFSLVSRTSLCVTEGSSPAIRYCSPAVATGANSIPQARSVILVLLPGKIHSFCKLLESKTFPLLGHPEEILE